VSSGMKPPDECISDYSKALLGAITRAFCNKMSLQEYTEACFSCLVNNSKNIPASFIHIDVAHLVHMVCRWKCLQGRKPIKDFYVRAIGLLIQSEYFDFFDSILRSILILALAETDGYDHDVRQETPAETARIFLENLISGIKNIDNVDAEKYKGISNESEFYFDSEKNEQNFLETPFLTTWLQSVERDSIQESAVIGNRLNAYYCPELKRPLLNICKEFSLWSGVMVKNFKCSNKIGSSARIEGYFADLKSIVIDKRKPRLRLDKFVVTHLRAIRGFMKIAKSVTKINEFQSLDFNEGDDNGSTIRTRELNHPLTVNHKEYPLDKNKKEVNKYVSLQTESDTNETEDDNLIWKPITKNAINDTTGNSELQPDTNEFKKIEIGLDTKMINNTKTKISEKNTLHLESDEFETDDDDFIWKPKIKDLMSDTTDESEEDVQIDTDGLKKIENSSGTKTINDIKGKSSETNDLQLKLDNIANYDNDLIFKPKIKNTTTT